MSKVSIIIPVYKVEEFLENCVNSLIKQSLTDIEIVLVDDGSPDNCPSICDEFAKKDSRIKVIHKKNEGVSAARNDGLKIATGEYIIFCDSDDWMEVHGLEELYKKATQEEADIVIGDVYLSKERENKYVKFYKDEFTTNDKDFIQELIKCDIYRTYCPNPAESGVAFGYGGPWNKLVKKRLIQDNNISFDIRLRGIFDDILYTAHILANANKISYIQKPVYFYRVNDNSITHSYKPDVMEINKAIFKSWQEFFDEQENGEIYRKAFYACVIRRLEEAMKLYFLNDSNKKENKTLKRELKKLVSQEPYNIAIKNVDRSKLSKKQRLLVYLSKMHLINLVHFFRIY